MIADCCVLQYHRDREERYRDTRDYTDYLRSLAAGYPPPHYLPPGPRYYDRLPYHYQDRRASYDRCSTVSVSASGNVPLSRSVDEFLRRTAGMERSRESERYRDRDRERDRRY